MPDINEVVSYSYNEIHKVPIQSEGLALVGWLWRNPRHPFKWTFTGNVERRGYPSGTRLVPVYSKPIVQQDSCPRCGKPMFLVDIGGGKTVPGCDCSP